MQGHALRGHSVGIGCALLIASVAGCSANDDGAQAAGGAAGTLASETSGGTAPGSSGSTASGGASDGGAPAATGGTTAQGGSESGGAPSSSGGTVSGEGGSGTGGTIDDCDCARGAYVPVCGVDGNVYDATCGDSCVPVQIACRGGVCPCPGAGGTGGVGQGGGAGNTGNIGVEFSCGTETCTVGESYCSEYMPGAGGSFMQTCATLPDVCRDQPTCACVCDAAPSRCGVDCHCGIAGAGFSIYCAGI